MSPVENQNKLPAPGTTNALSAEAPIPRVDPDRWIQEYGDVLFGFAAMRVRDRAIAQDLVQETFLAAMKAKDGFQGRSSERSWLFGILRNKLVDYYRLQAREVPLGDPESFLPEEKGIFAEGGVGKDGWAKGFGPQAWETPEEVLISKEFQEALKSCLSRLPERVGQVFVLREIDGTPAEQVCKELGLSPNNLWVMLHRARLGLRRCLEVNWFGKKSTDT
jgi:RNA polymerase sigma-70 factor, ECF subfamily